MCTHYEEIFQEINKLKFLMTFAMKSGDVEAYKKKLKILLEDVLNDKEEIVHKDKKDIKEYTMEELSEYDGEDGKPAYIAIKDIVYDLTNLDILKQESHSDLELGKDNTLLFKKCHGDNTEILKKVPVVGKIKYEKSRKKIMADFILIKDYDGN